MGSLLEDRQSPNKQGLVYILQKIFFSFHAMVSLSTAWFLPKVPPLALFLLILFIVFFLKILESHNKLLLYPQRTKIIYTS